MIIKTSICKALTGLVIFILLLGQIGTDLQQTLLRRDLVHAWFSIRPSQPRSDALHDDIPDGWFVQTWEGATAIYKIVTDQVFTGKKAASIQRTNILGGVALSQDVVVPFNSQLLLRVYSRGVGGAIQVLQGGNTLGWVDIPGSNNWQYYQLIFRVSSNSRTIRLLLRAGELGTIYFDDAFVGIVKENKEGSNLLENPDFEEDGFIGDPLNWWFSEIFAKVNHYLIPNGIAYTNIGDMLNGNISAIQKRALNLGENCSESPNMTGWLLARGSEFEKSSGVSAREKLYLLAIDLAPNCPQPYAALARLYESNQSCWRAAELYDKAANLSEGTPQFGYYSFQEGLIRQRCTGELEKAAIAYQKAVKSSGWEGAIWYYGAAPFFLGQVLEALGRPHEAVIAYKLVAACDKCVEYQTAAIKKIALLGLIH